MKKLALVVLLFVLLVGAMPTMAQEGNETIVYALDFVDIENVNNQWLDSPINLTLDNVVDHMSNVSPNGDCWQYTTIAKLLSSEFVIIRHTHCLVWYESWNVDFITFQDINGETFDF